MKKVFKFMILCFMVIPCMFVSGCFNKDNEIIDEKFDKYLLALNKTLSSNVYTVVAGETTESSDEEHSSLESVVTKDSNGYFLKIATAENVNRFSVVKVNDTYIEYVDSRNEKTARYVAVEDFNSQYSLASSSASPEFFQINTKALLEDYVEQFLKDSFSDDITVATDFSIKKKNDSYVLVVSATSTIENDGNTANASFTLKITYGEKISKCVGTFEVSVVGGVESYYKVVSQSNIDYSYNENYDIDDFSSYPTPVVE